MMQHLPPGTKIIIRTPRAEMHGSVIHADNWGREGQDNWYIEFNIDVDKSIRGHNYSGTYGYWKQGCDGGELEVCEDAA